MEKVLYLLCGIPGSGKSTWAKNRVISEGGAYISRDEIRFGMIGADDDYFAHETKVFNEFVRRISEALAASDEVYVDATHISEASREKVLRRVVMPEGTEIIPVVFRTPLEVCLQRNSKREGLARVPDSAIKNMSKSFRSPALDARGYRNIYLIEYIPPLEVKNDLAHV